MGKITVEELRSLAEAERDENLASLGADAHIGGWGQYAWLYDEQQFAHFCQSLRQVDIWVDYDRDDFGFTGRWRYCSSVDFDDLKNISGERWKEFLSSPENELLRSTNVAAMVTHVGDAAFDWANLSMSLRYRGVLDPILREIATGSTIVSYWSQLATFPHRSWKWRVIANWKGQPWWLDSN